VAVLTVAHMGAWKEVTYWNQQQQTSAALAFASFESSAAAAAAIMNDAAEYCLEMARTLHKFAALHLRQHHGQVQADNGP
jgi:hypothetical protein